MSGARGQYAKRVDGNHAEIRDALRAIGVGMLDTSRAGCGLPDLICVSHGKLHLVEIKNSRRPPSARVLTVAQAQFHAMLSRHGVDVHIVNTVDEAMSIFGARVELTGPESYTENAR